MPANFNSDGYSRLVIDHVTKYDAGTYDCIAENPAGRATAMTNVVVKIPPRFLLPPMPMAVSVKESIILHCEANGEPSPTVIWTKDGVPLGPNADGRIEFTQQRSLIIHESDVISIFLYFFNFFNKISSSAWRFWRISMCCLE